MPSNTAPMNIPDTNVEKWQEIVDIMSGIINIPAGLVMRLNGPDIEVFVSSNSEGNPYHPGDSEKVWDSGLYCETVIKSREKLLVPNALKDPDWRNNPDVKLNMISYLGFPIHYPDGKPFGTICVLDNKENGYSEIVENLIRKFRNTIQRDLEMIYMNRTLGDENRKLLDYLEEIQTLRKIVPMCAHCKSIRDEKGNWYKIEQYLAREKKAAVSHSICPECAEAHYPEMKLYE